MSRRPVTEPLEPRRLLTYVMLDYHVATGGGDMGGAYGPGIDTWSDTASTPYELEGNPNSGYTHIAYEWSASPDLFGPRVNNPTTDWTVDVNGQQVYREQQSNWIDISGSSSYHEYIADGPPTVTAATGATSASYILPSPSSGGGTLDASFVFESDNWANEFGTDSHGNPMNGIGFTVDYVEFGIHTANPSVDGETIAVETTTDVLVTVLDDWGDPVVGATVTVVDYDEYVIDLESIAMTNSEGIATFSVEGIGPGTSEFEVITNRGGDANANIVVQQPKLSISSTADGSEDPDPEKPADGPKPIVFHVSRWGAPDDEPLTVYLQTPTGTADSSDYGSVPQQIVIEADESSATFEVVPDDDDEIEETETVIIEVAPHPDNYYGFADPQNPPEAEAEITDNDWKIRTVRLNFVGDQVIKKDDGSGNYQGDDWTDLNADGDVDDGWVDLDDDGIQDSDELEYRNPVSYVRSGILDGTGNPQDTTVKITIEFTIEGTTTGTWNITGSGNGWDFVDPTGDTGLSHSFSADAPLGDTIEFYEDFATNWNVERTPPVAAGAEGEPPTTDENYGPTKNDLYVTGAAASGAFHTIVDIGSRNAAGLKPNNVTGQQSVSDAIWGEFSDNSVKRVDDVNPMVYSHNPAGFGFTAAEMLTRPDGRGQCTAWADLLILTLEAQGVSATSTRIDPPGDRFAVKSMPAQGSGLANYFPGTLAAGGFNFHQVVRIDVYQDRIYDPSYGTLTIKTDARSVELKYEDQNITDFRFGPGNWVANVLGDPLQLSFTP